MHAINRAALATIFIAATSSAPSHAQPAGLQDFNGSFSGGGTLKRATESNSRALNCTFSGSTAGSRLALNGRCSAGILSTTSNISLNLDPASQRLTGSYRDGTGTIANLSGSRRGNVLTVAFNETAESMNPGRPVGSPLGRAAATRASRGCACA